jgi:transposase
MRAGGGSSGILRKRIFERLRDEHGYAGGITIVDDYVLARRLRQRKVFVPLQHDPGHAQADFGEALAEIAGVERKIHFFAIDLPHSDACVVQAYPAETTEAFWGSSRTTSAGTSTTSSAP